MQFKDRLRELRANAGLTQQQVADRSGIPVGSLRGHEQGKRIPSWVSVVWLAKALGVSTDVFSDCDEVTSEALKKRVRAKQKELRSRYRVGDR
jgi:transcriptional regulator with XRE-family HTH domain